MSLMASKMRTSAINSEAVLERASNSASIDEVIIVGCFNALQPIAAPKRIKRYP